MVSPEHIDTNKQNFYTIEQVATRTGFTKRTLRYYEEVGLLPLTDRTEGNYRRYSEDDIERLDRIKNLRDLMGFSLTDIRELLDAEDEREQLKAAYRNETDGAAKILQLERTDEIIQHQLQLIEQKLVGLEQMRDMLLAKLEAHKQKRLELLQNE
jgi:DNA-binding transcriptional MerR regulator